MKTMGLSITALLLLLVLDVVSSRNEEICHGGFYDILFCLGEPVTKYYYNTISNSCRAFDYYQSCENYGGIGNKKNKFDSMADCINTCYDVPSNSTPASSIKHTSILPESAIVTSVLNFATTSYMEHVSTMPIHGRSSSPPPSPSSSSSSKYQKPPQPTSVSNTQISPVLSSSSSSSRSYSFTIIIQKPPHPTASSSSSEDQFYNQMFIYGSLTVFFVVVLSLVIAGSIFVIMYLSYRRRKRVLESPSSEMPSSINSSSSRSDEAENNSICMLPHSGSQSSSPSELIEA